MTPSSEIYIFTDPVLSAMTKDDPNIARAEAKIQELNAEFLKLESRAKEKGPDAEERFNQAASEFKKNRAALEKSIKELESSGEHNMKEKQKGVDRALKEFDTSLEKTRYQFS
jgi:F0F1-type ATP synthase membrane subunit b/b'